MAIGKMKPESSLKGLVVNMVSSLLGMVGPTIIVSYISAL
jgi:hypothetical protein